MSSNIEVVFQAIFISTKHWTRGRRGHVGFILYTQKAVPNRYEKFP